MKRRGEQTGSGPTTGRVEGVSVPELLRELCRARTTGVLRVRRASVEKALYIQSGRIIFASSTDPDERLGIRLLQQNALRLAELEAAAERLHTGRRIGTLLVEAGVLSPDELVVGVIEQVKAIVLDLLSWVRGEYRYEAGPLPTDEVITLGMRTEQLLLEGLRVFQSIGALRRAVGGPYAIYKLSDAWDALAEQLDLDEREEALLERLNEGPSSVERICDEVFLSDFEIHRTLYAFMVLGLVERCPAHVTAEGERLIRPEQGESFAAFLVRLSDDGQSGLLLARRHGIERGFHLRRGHCSFATSDTHDDGLLHFLLRRGVISLADAEEVVQRLPSEQRIGGILRQLGIIEDAELCELVRQQLRELVCDTVAWTDCSVVFHPNVPLELEEIEIERPTAAVVAAGLRRVQSWNRIAEGCGPMDESVALVPGHLAVIETMEPTEDELRIVSMLGEPHSPRELCEKLPFGDLRVCQVVWQLRMLGVLDDARTVANAAAADAAAEDEALQAQIDAEAHEEALAAPGEPALDYDPPIVASMSHEAAFAENSGRPRPGDWDYEPEPATEVPSVEALQSHDSLNEPAPESDPEGESEHEEEPSAEATADEEIVDASALEEDASTFEISETTDEVVDEPDLYEPSPDATQRLSRDAVEEALRGASAPEEAEAPVETEGSVEAEAPVETAAPIDAVAEDAPALDAVDESDAETGEATAPEAEAEPEHEAEPEPEVEAVEQVEASEEPVEEHDEPEQQDEQEPVLHGDGDATQQVEPLWDASETVDGPEGSDEPESHDEQPETSFELSPDATQALDRAQIEQALQGDEPYSESDDEPVEASGDEEAYDDEQHDEEPQQHDEAYAEVEQEPWQAPHELDEAIAVFNAQQRVIFRTVRAEVGAGAANFIRSNCLGTGGEQSPVGEAALNGDGSWQVEGLRARAEEIRIDDPRATYAALVEREIEALRMLIGDNRAAVLTEQVERAASRQRV